MATEWGELDNGMRMLKVSVPDSRPPEVRKMLGYANALKGLLKVDFLRYLKSWALSAEDIENLLCVMQSYPRYAINGQRMKWLEEYKKTLSVAPDAKVKQHYSDGLLELFHYNTDLIDSLVGLSDDEIAKKIKSWKGQTDKFGKPLIENPDNSLKSRYAHELKANGLIKQSETSFRLKL